MHADDGVVPEVPHAPVQAGARLDPVLTVPARRFHGADVLLPCADVAVGDAVQVVGAPDRNDRYDPRAGHRLGGVDHRRASFSSMGAEAEPEQVRRALRPLAHLVRGHGHRRAEVHDIPVQDFGEPPQPDGVRPILRPQVDVGGAPTRAVRRGLSATARPGKEPTAAVHVRIGGALRVEPGELLSASTARRLHAGRGLRVGFQPARQRRDGPEVVEWHARQSFAQYPRPRRLAAP